MADEPIPGNPIGPDPPPGRGDRGKFLPGHTFSKKPHRSRMAELRRAALEAIDEKTVCAVLRRMAVAAIKDGDVAAGRLVLEYTLGKAPAAVEISGPGGEPLGMTLEHVEAAVLEAMKPYGAGAQFQLAAALRGLVSDADAG